MKRLIFAIALSSALLAGCSGDKPGTADGSIRLEMRVYQVPPEDTDAIVKTLFNVLGTGDKGTGRASSPAPGQIVVLAPANLQDSIAQTLKSIKPAAKTKAEVAPAQQMRLDYWSVEALAGAGPDAPSLKELTPAFAELRKQLGDVHFVAVNHINGVSSLGEKVERSYPSNLGVSGNPTLSQLNYELNNRPEGLMLRITSGEQIPYYTSSGGAGATQYVNIGGTTTTLVRLGQILVLAQNFVPVNVANPSAGSRAIHLSLIRVDAINPTP
ncbi:MAG: hypothetical protein IJI03_11630 [Rudaea sp.]|nr:hypothetical protein [Rudaea sp.]